VAITVSADGNTAIVGGPRVDDSLGAAWVFTRSGGSWSQQGTKLRGTGAVIEPDRPTVGGAGQGESVALSADGNTAIVGGPWDSWPGAAWVFTRSEGVWTQQGSKLVGAGSVPNRADPTMGRAIMQGSSVALSASGDIAIVGGPDDNADAGAAWVFARKDGNWTQLQKLTGSDAVAGTSKGAVKGALQGSSVALSIDGNTAIVGGVGDSEVGAAWVFSKLSVAPLPAHNPSSTTNNNSEKSIAQYDDETVCRSALTSDTLDQWEQNPEYLAYVTEARRRGYSVDTCRQKVPEASSASTPATPNPTAPDRADKTFGTVVLYMPIAELLASDERCEPLPPILKEVLAEMVRTETAENQRVLEAMRRSLLVKKWSPAEHDDICPHAKQKTREWMEDIHKLQSR
jgi:hypothetical protein